MATIHHGLAQRVLSNPDPIMFHLIFVILIEIKRMRGRKA
jgi:hypothetical protein